MTYGVLTAKHVGGFCLWDSKYTTYDVMHPDCPYQQDLVAQFIESFKSRGLKVGLYYCWRHPGFGDPTKFKVLPPECDPATHSLKEQIEFQKKQIAELVEQYPDVFYIWNDALDDQDHACGTKHKPSSAACAQTSLPVRTGGTGARKGRRIVDIAVKELRHFPEDNTAPGETCWKLEQKWFWNEGFRAGNAQRASWVTWRRRMPGIRIFCSTSARIGMVRSSNQASRRWRKLARPFQNRCMRSTQLPSNQGEQMTYSAYRKRRSTPVAFSKGLAVTLGILLMFLTTPSPAAGPRSTMAIPDFTQGDKIPDGREPRLDARGHGGPRVDVQ